MVEAGRSPNIEILTLSEVEEVKGKPGDFRVKVKCYPRYIDPDKCTACGECMKYCPTLAIDGYNASLQFTKAIRIDFPQAVPTVFYIDREKCLRLNHETCQLCINVCGPKAINFDMEPEVRELRVGAVVLAVGFGEVPSEAIKAFGFGEVSDVVTSIEMERISCVSGPTEGEVVRPSDGRHPKKIAYIQCVGSRDERCKRGFCSSVCCMYAVKQASVVKEHEPDCEITLFFMDVRTQGKGFDASFERAVKKHGFRVIRARPGKVEKVGPYVAVSYVTEDGEVKRELYDMVVLSVGLSPPEDAERISKVFGVELNEFNFLKTNSFSPIVTTREGIFAIGACQGPKDIPDSVTQGSGVAGAISELLKEGRFSQFVKKEYPPEDEELSRGDVRIGVFVCHCGVNIAGVVNVEEVKEFAKELPGVVHAETVLYSCSQDALESLKEKIKKYKLNRVVIAACTPRTHEPLFQDTLREAGLNPCLIEMANIRDQCSWVHAKEPEKATEKAKELVKMAVFKASKLKPLTTQEVKVNPAALVIGGGVAGLVSALSIAEQGYQVYLVEKEEELGGNFKRLRFLIDEGNPEKWLKSLIKKVLEKDNIKVFTRARVKSVSGYIGNFEVTVEAGGKEEVLKCGTVVVATGGEEHRPKSYPLDGKKVITQLEFEERLKRKRGIKSLKRVVMIQCAGSRGEELPYCSKICCQQALKNAINLKKLNPDVDVFILYQDMRAYGFYEKYFLEARRLGVKFVRFRGSERPKVKKEGRKYKVVVKDLILGEELDILADLVVLSVGIKPRVDEELLNLLKLSTTEEGFLLEAHIKLRPVETPSDGVFVCGLVHSPRPVDEVIAQAKAAAAKACIPLAKGVVETSPIVAEVNESACIGCGICVELCPFSAIELYKVDKRRKARVIKANCKGCGICASHCPTFAIDVGGFTNEALISQIRGFKRDRKSNEELNVEAGG